MIPFYKYIRPSWYFNSNKEFSKVFDIPAEFNIYLDTYNDFTSNEATIIDKSYQLLISGFIPQKKNSFNLINLNKLSLIDNYRLLKRHQSFKWVVFVLFIRILFLNNPFKEISAFLSIIKIKKVNLENLKVYIKNFQDSKFSIDFNINLNTLVSVVIPTLNRYQYLEQVLKDLEVQSFKNFEVLVIDQSDNFREDFYLNWNLTLKVYFQNEKALWKARNFGIQNAIGDFILLTEDDVKFNEKFIENHLKCIFKFNCDVSNGVFFPLNSTIPSNKNLFCIADQFATGNVLLKKSIFNNLGLFDLQFEKQRMGDGEFGLRVNKSNFIAISNPEAFCYDVKAPIGGLREMGSWDPWRPKKIFAPRPIPSVLYYIRSYFGIKSALLEIIISMWSSIIPYKYKRNIYIKPLFIFISFIISPLLFISIVRSWKIASSMIKSGPIIPKLKNV